MAKFYLTYYEEYPIYEPAEGGYYYSGNQVIGFLEYDNFYDAYRDIKRSTLVAGDFTSHYIGERRTLRFETEAGFESDVRGWHPYC